MDKLTQSKFKSCGAINTTPAGKLIFLFLNELTFWESDGVIISQRVIANALHLSKSAIRRNLHRLAELGVISIIPTYYEDGGRTANKYIVW